MRAGLLNEIVKVYRPVVTTNSVGEQVTSYSVVHSYRARVVHRSHNREDRQGEIMYPNVYELQVRIYCDIDDYDIILWQGHYYRLTQAPVSDRVTQCKTLMIEQAQDDIPINDGN